MQDVRTIGVLGAGQMGRGITQVAVQSGLMIKLYDVSDNYLKSGLQFIKDQLLKGADKGKWTKDVALQAFDLIRPTLKIDDLADVDVVIEAATEQIDLKVDLFAKLDRIVGPNVTLASNTSSISITRIGAATKRPSIPCRACRLR